MKHTLTYLSLPLAALLLTGCAAEEPVSQEPKVEQQSEQKTAPEQTKPVQEKPKTTDAASEQTTDATSSKPASPAAKPSAKEALFPVTNRFKSTAVICPVTGNQTSSSTSALVTGSTGRLRTNMHNWLKSSLKKSPYKMMPRRRHPPAVTTRMKRRSPVSRVHSLMKDTSLPTHLAESQTPITSPLRTVHSIGTAIRLIWKTPSVKPVK